MIDGQTPANGWVHAMPGYTHAPTLGWRGGYPFCGICVTPITNPDWPAARPLTLTGRAQVTPEQKTRERATDQSTVSAGAQPMTATMRPLDGAGALSLDPTLPRPVSVSARFAEVLREHACGWSPCGDGCAEDIMERLRARGLMLADFGMPTAHDEELT